MSGLTPILDTLLHQVLGKRVDTPVVRDQPAPVSPKASSDAVQSARSDSRLHQQTQHRLNDLANVRSESSGTPTGVASARADQPTPSAQTHLSRAAMDIATLLAKFPAAEGATLPTRAAALSPGLPLMSAPLASALKDALIFSGAFYESHLLRWSQGRLPAQMLWREPQAWLGLVFRPVNQAPSPLTARPHGWLGAALHAGPADTPIRQGVARAVNGRSPVIEGPLRPIGPQPRAAAAALSSRVEMAAGKVTSSSPEEMLLTARSHQLNHAGAPDSLQILVRHQLELLVSPQVHWAGEVYPGLPMAMELMPRVQSEAENAARQEDQEEQAQPWQARVQMTLPRLGDVVVVFKNAGSDWQIEILPRSTQALAPLENGLDRLEERFQNARIAANVRLLTDEVVDA